MSTIQTNGKKSSNSSSIANTPSSTPLTGMPNGNAQGNMQNSPPPNNNAPKYGTLVPNRIFVGGISANTTEGELMQLFSSYGTVKAAKIIQDRAGVSKGYGFITFENEDDAKRPLREADNIVLRERKLNIAPAIKKQPFNRAFDASSPSAVAAGNAAQFFFPPGAAVPYFQGGVAYYPQPATAPGDLNSQQPVYQPPPVYPAQTGPPQAATYPSMMFPTQTIYMPQQYPMPMPYEFNYYQSNGAPPTAQFMVTNQNGPGGSQCPSIPPPPGSPPRPPCYNQLPTYTPNEPIFYNFPIYNPALEGHPLFTEAFELGAPGPYTEDYSQQVIELSSNDMSHISPPTQTRPLPPHHTNSVNFDNTVTNNNNINKSNKNNPLEGKTRSDDSRNSNTPVVSLLSIDQQQEKDYTSMQGGRRRKPTAAPPTSSNLHHHHLYPTTNGYIGYNHPLQYASSYNGTLYNYRRANGYDGRKTRQHRTFNNNNNDSSRSSLRTDSNSSASVVDETKVVEERTKSTPPPPPYSPMTPQFKLISNNNNNNYSSRSYQNTSRYNTNRYGYGYNDRFKGNSDKLKNGVNNDHSSPPSSTSSPNVPPPPQSSTVVPQQQVHVVPPQTTFPPQRRSRRSIRRNGNVNEIGAGDAPLPGDVEICKKFDVLKL